MELQTFNSTQFGELRTAEIEGKIYYCGNDVARALGYTNSRKALSDHCRYVTKRYVPHPQNSAKKIEMSFIPEGDVYRLTVRSKLPQAERFESWVFDEVLPQINHTGGYRVPQNPMEALQLMFDAQRNTDMRVTNLKEDVDNRFQDLPLVGDEPEEIVSEVNAIALRLLGGKKSNAYSDKSLRSRVYQDIWHEVKHKFGVRKYKAIKRKYMPNVKAVLEAYTCPQNLLEEILAVNQQDEASCGNT